MRKFSRRRRLGADRSRLVILTIVSVLLAAGCGGSKKEAGSALSVDAPLGLDQAGLALRQTRVEELVKACMKRAGFDYTPVDPSVTRAAIVGTSGLSDSEYTRQFGYGISTVFEKVVEISQSANSVDPNIAYRSHLDAAGQGAYDIALTGGNSDLSVSVAVGAAKSGDLSGLSGCVKDGTDAVFGDANVTAALAKIEELDQRAEADPRIVAAKEKWSKCMKQAGFVYADPNSVDGAIQDKLASIIGANAAKSLSGEGPFNPSAFSSAVLPAYDKVALAALQAEEVATAQADLSCEEKYVSDVEAKVKGEYEKKFAIENAVLLSKAQANFGAGK